MNTHEHRRFVRLVNEAAAIAERESLQGPLADLKHALSSLPEPTEVKDPRHVARKLGSFTITEMSEAMGVSRPTADKAVRKMIERGTVEDTGLRRKHNGSGRPAPVFQYVTIDAPTRARPKRTPVEVEAIQDMRIGRPAPPASAPSGKKPRVADPEIRRLVEAAKRHGCRVERKGSGHLAVYAPNGDIINLPFTPSDHRAVLNCRSQLRRAGVGV